MLSGPIRIKKWTRLRCSCGCPAAAHNLRLININLGVTQPVLLHTQVHIGSIYFFEDRAAGHAVAQLA
jgi:hypothetical protein